MYTCNMVKYPTDIDRRQPKFTITSMAEGVKLMTAEKQYGLHII